MSDEVNSVSSLRKAKRRFVINLCLFGVLLMAAALIFTSSEETVQKPAEPESPAPEPLSLNEKAYLAGQMLGLSEHPDTMPEYGSEWVMKISKQAVKRNLALEDVGEAELALLTAAFYKGYTERFHEYYDDHAAREFGYQYGVRFNPDIHGFFPNSTIGKLALNRTKLEEQFHIPDEPTWRLFCRAFDAGFLQGYPRVVDGVTVQSRYERVPLFNE
jgi:hypothetical protein